ncbi:MAG: hypothetical protein J6N71_01360 [Muribaculaceae bacterium]|nr:hypothetical protein [Muribaculaceae bacterium]
MDRINVPGHFPSGNFYQCQPGAEPHHQGTPVPDVNKSRILLAILMAGLSTGAIGCVAL